MGVLSLNASRLPIRKLSPTVGKVPTTRARARIKAPMVDSPAMLQKVLRQQAAIARFGSFALRELDLMKILSEAKCADIAPSRMIFSRLPAMVGKRE